MLCNKPQDIKHILGVVNLYENKGYDFTEEINSLFIKACIRCEDPKAAAIAIAKYENRIGAWTSITAFSRLLEVLLEKGEFEILIDAVSTMYRKGIAPGDNDTKIIIDKLVELNNKDLINKIKESMKIKLSNEKIQKLFVNEKPADVQEEVIAEVK